MKLIGRTLVMLLGLLAIAMFWQALVFGVMPLIILDFVIRIRVRRQAEGLLLYLDRTMPGIWQRT